MRRKPGRFVSAASIELAGLGVGRAFPRTLRALDRAQWFSPDELAGRQHGRLVTMLRHAVEHVPFYRELGLDPAELPSADALARFPVVTKAMYRSRPDVDFLARNIGPERRYQSSTSGSTGEPFSFWLDRRLRPIVGASHLLYDSWFGLRPFDRHIRIMAPAPEPVAPTQPAPLWARLRYAVGPRLQSLYESRTQERIQVLEVGQEQIENVYRRIEQFRPAYIVGYTSSVATVADELYRSNLRVSRPLEAVVVVAEALTPLRRHLIDRYFEAPIANRYGQRELAFWVAQSCPETPDRFHMNTELAVWEIVRDDGTPAAPGEQGRVVLTSLHNFAMPFIRYDTGDRAVAGSGVCSCGRGFPLVEQLEGRSAETLRLPSGKEISPVVLGHYLFVFKDYVEAIRHYQLVADGTDHARLLVVPTHPLEAAEREHMERDLVELFQGELRVTVEKVDEIALEPSGKRPIIKIAAEPGVRT